MRQALLLAAAGGRALGLAPRAYAEAWLRVASIAKRRSARIVVTRTIGAFQPSWPGSLSETLIVNQSRRFSNLLREEEELE